MLYLFSLLLLISNQILFLNGAISDLRKCADQFCKVKISEGRTTQLYIPIDKDVLPCKNDEKVSIYSKQAGQNPGLWGVEINGKRGYFPSKFIKEDKIHVKFPEYIVPTKISHSDTVGDDSPGVQKSKLDIRDDTVGNEDFTHKEVPMESLLLSPEDAEFDSLSILSAKDEDGNSANKPSEIKVKPVDENNLNNVNKNNVQDVNGSADEVDKSSSNEEIKITVTKSNIETNNVQENNENKNGQSAQNIDLEDKSLEGGKQTNGASNIIEDRKRTEEQKVINTGDIKVVNPDEKVNVEVKEEIRNKEMDNDEGNGNEGEDNGSEYIIATNVEEGKDSNVVKRDAEKLFPDEPQYIEKHSEDEIKTEEVERSSSFIGDSSQISDGVSSAGSSKSTPELNLKISDSLNKEAASVHQIANPTPAQFEVVEGTQIPVDFYEPFSSPEVTSGPSLKASSQLEDSPATERTLPINKFPGVPLTEPPLLKNMLGLHQNSEQLSETKLISQEAGKGSIVENSDSVVQNGGGLIEDRIASSNEKVSGAENTIEDQVIENFIKENIDDIQPEQDDSVDFSTPKPETILENDSQSKIESENIQNGNIDTQDHASIMEGFESKESLDKTEQVESSESSKSKIENSEGQKDPTENTASSQNPNSNLENTENKIKFIDLPENSDEVESDPSGDGLFSSLTNTFNFLKGKTESENIEHSTDGQENNGIDQATKNVEHILQPDETSVEDVIVNTGNTGEDSKDDTSKEVIENTTGESTENKAQDAIQDTIENTTEDENSDTVEKIPFIDPEDKSVITEAKKLESEVVENSFVSSESELSDDHHGDNNGAVHSFKKKLLHASESVYQWVTYVLQMNEGMVLALEGELADPHLSTGTVVFLLVVAATILFLYLAHMIMVKLSRESPLLEMMNKLDRKSRIMSEENNNLKRRLTDSNGQIKSSVDPVALHKLQQQFIFKEENYMREIDEFRERNEQMEAELDTSTSREVELHDMADQLLKDKKESEEKMTIFEESINQLQMMLDNQEQRVGGLTSDLTLKTRLNEELRNELKFSMSKVTKLEYQIEQLAQSLEEVNTTKQDLSKKLNEEEQNALSLKAMNDTLRQEVDKVSNDSQNYYKELQKLLQEVRKIKQKLHNKEAECQISKECLKKLQVLTEGGGNDIHGKLAEIFKIIEVKTQLAVVQSERAILQTTYEENESKLTLQSKDLATTQNENLRLRETTATLQKERNDAVSRLEVIAKHYEEREAQLKKALESQEGLLQTAEGSANAVSNRIQTYELEVESRRSQMESLKIELEEQKQAHKLQLANEEKKLHETWLTARAAERRQEELRQENTQLRQSLTHMQSAKPPPKRVAANGSVSSPLPMENDVSAMHPGLPPLDLNGTLPFPPPMMFPGRPPMPGLPPLPPFAPLPPPMADRRLPPAGRIASPPGYDRRSYSPESDRSRYSDHRYSPGPPRYSPNNHHRGHSPDRSNHMRRNPPPLRRAQRSPSPSLRRSQRSPSPLDSRQRHSPRERWYNHSPQGPSKNHRSPPMDYYDSVHENRTNSGKGKKTSTPNDR